MDASERHGLAHLSERALLLHCEDRLDDDGDGLVDVGLDPGARNPGAPTTSFSEDVRGVVWLRRRDNEDYPQIDDVFVPRNHRDTANRRTAHPDEHRSPEIKRIEVLTTNTTPAVESRINERAALRGPSSLGEHPCALRRPLMRPPPPFGRLLGT